LQVFVQSFGCRASQADGAAIETSLAARGHHVAPDAHSADLIVLNTCTVTHSADVDTRRIVRGLHRDHPHARLLVTGCYAQRAPEELAALDGVEWVVGNGSKADIADLVSLEGEQYHGGVPAAGLSALGAFAAAPVGDAHAGRARPNLKIQDGCSNRCSFCIIPAVRGRSRSATLASVAEQVRALEQRFPEVVLTGINLGRWGRDLPERLSFAGLLRTLLLETGVRRLRISSVEPMDWSRELLELVAGESRIAPHMHIPLQSGSDAVLKRMFRKYRTRHYATRVRLARELMPDAAIGADVMTGFPGETDEEFEETLRFVEAEPFTYLHVFTYSERPGTPAAGYADPVPVPVRQERTRRLRALGEEKNRAFRQSMRGQLLSAVTLEEPGAALTGNFLKVRLTHPRPSHQLIDVRIGPERNGVLHEETPFVVL
jgi:threonylcarbamoyladenosine tRNA methylthiotransferase MtaB